MQKIVTLNSSCVGAAMPGDGAGVADSNNITAAEHKLDYSFGYFNLINNYCCRDRIFSLYEGASGSPG